MWVCNPAILFSAIWIVVFALFSLRLSELLDPLRAETALLIVGSGVAFMLGWLAESLPHRRISIGPIVSAAHLRARICTATVGRRLRLGWAVFLLGVGGEVVYFGGAPLLSLFDIGADIRYTDFGISGLHGLFNSIFFSCSTIQLARYLLSPAGRYRATALLVPVLYPVLTVSRQGFISLLAEYFFIYLLLRRPSLKMFWKVAVVFVGLFLLFGYIGDLRSGRESIIELASPVFDYPDWLPSAFIWFYIYICTPINNVNFNIDISPHYFPIETLGSFIPAVLRDKVLDAVDATSAWSVANESFNVSSLFQSLVSDFGVAGSVVFLFACSLLFARVMRRARTSSSAFFMLVVLLHGLTLSFFAGLLFHLVFVFQILISHLIVRPARTKRQP